MTPLSNFAGPDQFCPANEVKSWVISAARYSETRRQKFRVDLRARSIHKTFEPNKTFGQKKEVFIDHSLYRFYANTFLRLPTPWLCNPSLASGDSVRRPFILLNTQVRLLDSLRVVSYIIINIRIGSNQGFRSFVAAWH